MIAVVDSGTLLTMWIAFTVIAVAGIVAVLVWAVRSRQFRDQDRARYLALWSGTEEASGAPPKSAPFDTKSSEPGAEAPGDDRRLGGSPGA
jgi:nitrogen fixation-related uncharacterized protein